MTFVPPVVQVPTAIVRISVTLADRIEYEEQPASQTASYQLRLVDEDGRTIPFDASRGDLIPHLTPDEIVQLQAFMSTLRARAESAIIG